MILCLRQPRLALLLAPCLFPIFEIGEIRTDLANGVLDDRAAVNGRAPREKDMKIPSFQRKKMIFPRKRTEFNPSEHFIITDRTFSVVLWFCGKKGARFSRTF